ncbi:MAG: regulatory protein GemA [Candidatus Omnitrophica bacterium]|nr:regulatory protein GemA [Candidatus Omnitrophota bacterium]
MSKLTNKEIGLVHIAAKAAGVDKANDPELYKATLIAHGGADSASKLTRAGYEKVMKHFETCGFKRKRQWKKGYKGRPGNMERNDSRAKQLQKIEALLTIGKKPWAYADGIAKRICRNPDGRPVERVAWVPDGQLYKIITALRHQARREGWELNE